MNYASRPTRRVERVMQVAGAVDPLEAITGLRTAMLAVANVASERTPAPKPATKMIQVQG